MAQLSPPGIDRSHISCVNSREELIYLLSRASELEHGLACVYLFAAYSLKGDVNEGGMSAEQAVMVRNWKRRLASVAVEEMLHMAQVSNLLTAIGGAPHLRRTNFPMSPLAFPLGIQLSLEPFSQSTIERLVCFEMPEAGILSPERQRVYNAIRERIAGPPGSLTPPAPFATSEPFEIDFSTVGEFYHKIGTGFAQIPEDVLFIGPPQAQANAAYLDLSGQLIAVTDAASAARAIEMIIEQGESPSSDHPDAHFAVFDAIRLEYASACEAAKRSGIPFEPVRPLVSNPMTRVYDDAAIGASLIDDPRSHEVADIFNTVYDTMLLMLLRFFAHGGESEEELRMLARGTLRMMASVLRPLGEGLAKMPAGAGFPGMNAGPGFGYNRDVHLLAHKESAWIFFLERVHDMAVRTARLAKGGDVPPEIDEASAALQSVGEHLVKYLPANAAARLQFHCPKGTGNASISAELNGPYIVRDLERLTNSKGEVLHTRHTVALCRCGGSAIKPYCDGTHARIGFDSAKSPERTPDAFTSYSGDAITVHDNRGTCCHFGNCTDHLPSVFNLKTEPLISPDGASPEAIMEIVRQCPSGALGYTYHGERYAGEERGEEIYVSENGPYHVRGGVALSNEAQNEGASKEHFALCRCGHSKNKPFCDGTHWYIKFKDEDN